MGILRHLRGEWVKVDLDVFNDGLSDTTFSSPGIVINRGKNVKIANQMRVVIIIHM